MRLLNTETWLLHEFVSDDSIPEYAILSHTWEEGEVTFDQWVSLTEDELSLMRGHRKIRDFGMKAAYNGFKWVWVDTCCIDKSSSADLTEAINSMFSWYSRAAVCYVYLSDIEPSPSYSGIRFSRWFTRGWTLQELIAPQQLSFYASDWSEIASKLDILGLLAEITKIDVQVLETGDLSEVSVAKKMSWAAMRETSRGEDKAYCLLGLFDVNLPLMYGEGAVKAFRRLQEAIMRITHDQSLFAWGTFVEKFSINPPPASSKWQPSEPQFGLFAESPADFKESGDIVPVDHGYAHIIDRARPPTVLHGGALVNLVIYKTRPCMRYWDKPQFAFQDEVEIAVLMVKPNEDSDVHLIAIALSAWGDGYHSRTRELCSIKLFPLGC
ncbi:HET-domain-containing protein [Sarocladium strictum]